MRKHLAPSLLFAAAVLSPVKSAMAQATGPYAFAPMDSYGFDSINRGNLDVHFSVPVFAKPGRGGANFSYALNYDGLIWSPVTTDSTTKWTPTENWGWTDATNVVYGYITFNAVFGTCTGGKAGTGTTLTESAFVYHDSHGVGHPIPYGSVSNLCVGGPPATSGTNPYPVPDNSGLTVYVANGNYYVINAAGEESSVPGYGTWDGNLGKPLSLTSSYTDTNGNQITASSSGVFTDTMGMTVLKIAGSGTPSSPEVFTYTDSNNASQTVTVNFGTYNVETAFGVSGISEYTQTGAYLVSSIAYSADSSSYSFTYEPTPGHSGYITGRLASVTLRTGGTISYAYTGGSEGIEPDGTYSGVTRTTSDGAYTYARSGVTGSSSETQRTDAYTNVDVSTYLITSGLFYEGDHKFYQGAATGTPLTETATCYNTTSTPPCTSGSLTAGISSVNYYYFANGVQYDTTSQTYTAAGSGLIASSTGDFGTTSYTYESFTGPNGLGFSEVSQINAVSTGNVSPARKITFGYDETTPTPTSGLPSHIAVTTSRGNLTSVHNWTSGTTHLDQTTTYDDAGQVLSQSDWNNHLTQMQYDTATDTLLTETIYPISSLSTSTTFDPNTGLLMYAYDLNTNETSYTYDGLERPLTIGTTPSNVTTTYTYPSTTSATVSVVRGPTPNNNGSVALDGYGRETSVTQVDAESGNETVTYTYDADGRPYSVTNPERSTSWSTDGTTTFSYDGASRPKTITEPGSAQVTLAYNGTVVGGKSENLVTVTDEQGKQEQYSVNGAGQILLANEPNSTGAFSLVTTYGYDVSGNVVSVQQAGGAANSSLYRNRSFAYDAAGRLVGSSTPEQGAITYAYVNASGGLCSGSPSNQCTRTDAIGTVTTYSYDTLNRSTGVTYSDTTHAVSVVYDQSSANGLTITNGKGRRTSMTDASGTSTWSYNTIGSVLTDKKTINGVTKTLSYTYNPDGTTNSMIDYLGNAVDYGYTSTSSLLSVTDAGTGMEFLSAPVYAPPGMLSSANLGNGVALANTFNNRLQPVTLGASKSGPVFGLSYGYGTASQNNGTIASISNTIPGQSNRSVFYTYDQLNRLQGALAGTLWGYTYGMDNFGNLYSMTPASGVTNSETSLNDPAPGVNNQLAGNVYDADGRITTDSGGTYYTYDAEGRVLTAAGYTYTYNGDGVRVEKTNGSNSRLYWPDESGVAADETDLSGGTAVRNVYVGGTQMAREDSSGNWTYFLHDHLGTTRMVLSSTGTVTNDVDYYPYGGIAYSSGSTTNLYGFTGYEADGESQTNYAVFRNESPTLGRFLRPDPYDGSYDITDPQSLNRYSYVGNRPLVSTDPLGLQDQPIDGPGCIQSSGTPEPCDYTPPTTCGDDDCDYSDSGAGGGGGGTGAGMINFWSISGGVVNVFYAGTGANVNTPGNVTSPRTAPNNSGWSLTQAQQTAIANAANGWLGTPYLMGGCSRKGADCSGSIIAIFAAAGIKLPGRFTSSDFAHSPLFMKVTGTPQVGDVGWYPGHVVLYGGAIVGGNCAGPCDVWSATHTGGNPYERASSSWFGTPTWYRYVGP